MMRHFLGLSLLAYGLVGCTNTPKPISTLSLKPCQLAAPGLADRVAAQCGTLSVYENRTTRQGRKLDLNIAVLPASSRAPKPEPLFFIPGGPGEAATQSFLPLVPIFDRINQDRDIVLVDQRGTGKSNPLTCPSNSLTTESTQAYLQNCVRQIQRRADPTQYTTPIAMADLDEVRARLGYEQINLYGGSYGTRAALSYLRQYPKRVRAMILDGVAPPNLSLGMSVSADAQRALDLIFERCQGEISCQKAFPNLRAEFNTLAERLDRSPQALTLPDPISGKRTTLTVNRATLVSTVRLFSYVPEAVALIPLLIHTAYETGNLETLAAQALLIGSQVQGGLSQGLFYSVVCAEDVPFYPAQLPTGAGTYFGALGVGAFTDGCKAWPHGKVDPSYKKPVTSAVPILLLSGEVDPVTPPANAALAAQTLSQSLHLVAPGQGHIVMGRGCLPKIATRFIAEGAVQGLETKCLRDLQPVPFFLTLAGPPP